MIVAGGIKQKLLHKFSKVFLVSPFIWMNVLFHALEHLDQYKALQKKGGKSVGALDTQITSNLQFP